MAASRESLKRALLEKTYAELEYRRIKRDRKYFIENYWYIPSDLSPGGKTLFKLWDYQEEILEAFDTNKRVVVAKCRQIGATTLACADSGHDLLFTDGRAEILILSYTQESADANLGMLDHGYRFLPDWLKARCPQRIDDATSKITFRFPDGRLTSAKSLVGTANSGAGKSTTRVIVDENALMKSPTATFRAVDATTLQRIKFAEDDRAVMIVLSTPRSNSDMFSRRFWSAWRGESDWKAIFVPAARSRFLVGYDPMVDGEEEFLAAWRARQADYDDEPWKFFQDFGRNPEEAFSESGRRRFPNLPDLDECMPFPYAGDVVKRGDRYEMRLVSEGDDAFDYSDEFLMSPMRFRVQPDEWDRSKLYVLAADPATGSGKDYSTFYVGCHGDEEDEVEVLASFSSNGMDPTEFAQKIDVVSRYFCGEKQRAALVAVERTTNELGQVLGHLKTRRHPNLFRYRDATKAVSHKSNDLGWPVHKKSKPEALSSLGRRFTVRYTDDGNPFFHCLLDGIDPDLRDELGTFVIKETAAGNLIYEGDGDAHDDRVMTAAILCAVLDTVKAKVRRNAESLSPGTDGEGAFVIGSVQEGQLFTSLNPAQFLEAEKRKARERQQRALHDAELREWQWDRAASAEALQG